MKNFRFISLVIALFFLQFSAIAQQVDFFEIDKTNKKSFRNYTKLKGLKGIDGTSAIVFGNMVHKFDDSLNQKLSLQFQPNALRGKVDYGNPVLFGGNLMTFKVKEGSIGSPPEVYYRRYSDSETPEKSKLITLPFKSYYPLASDIHFEISENGRFLLLMYRLGKSGPESYSITVLNKNLKEIYTREMSLKLESNYYLNPTFLSAELPFGKFSKVILDNRANVHLLGIHINKKAKKENIQKLIPFVTTFDISKDSAATFEVKFPLEFELDGNELAFHFDEDLREFVFGGFSKKENKKIFYSRYKVKEAEISDVQILDLPEELGPPEDAAAFLYTREIYLKKNGEILLLGEYDHTKGLKRGGRKWIYESTTSDEHIIVDCRHILAININQNGVISFSKKIKKRQSPTVYLESSFTSICTGNDVQLIFGAVEGTDEIKNVLITESGEVKETVLEDGTDEVVKILAREDDKYAAIRSCLAGRISTNTILIPVKKGKEFTIMRIRF